ncbi:hypothetical protein Tco_0411300 [Tanacetum coccineum]
MCLVRECWTRLHEMAMAAFESQYIDKDTYLASAKDIKNVADLQGRVQNTFGVPAGTYTLRYIWEENVPTVLDSEDDLVTLKNTIDGVVLVESYQNLESFTSTSDIGVMAVFYPKCSFV